MTTEDDDFDTAFDEHTNAGETHEEVEPKPEASAETQAPEGNEPPSDEETDTPESTEDEPEPEPEPNAEPESGLNEDATEGEEEPVNWRERAEQAEQRMSSWEGRLKTKDREIEALRLQLEGDPSLAGDEEGVADTGNDELARFREDYPDLGEQVETIIDRRVKEAIGPVAEQAQRLSHEQHFSKIAAAHPDYSDIAQSEAFDAWVNEQPSYVQPAIQAVFHHGSADEVISLLDGFKQVQKVAAKRTAEEAQNRKRSAQRQAAAAVRSRPGEPPVAEPDPDDFDAAWDQAQ